MAHTTLSIRSATVASIVLMASSALLASAALADDEGFSGQDLRYNNFDFTSLARADFSSAELQNVSFLGSDLRGAVGLETLIFEPGSAPTYNGRTRFDAGFDPQANGWVLVLLPEPSIPALIGLGLVGLSVCHRLARQLPGSRESI